MKLERNRRSGLEDRVRMSEIDLMIFELIEEDTYQIGRDSTPSYAANRAGFAANSVLEEDGGFDGML